MSMKRRRMGLLRQVPGGKCWLCGGNVKRKGLDRNHPAAPSVDHVKPLSRNGTNKRKNLLLAHRHCNNVRGTASIVLDKDEQRLFAAKLADAVKRWDLNRERAGMEE